MKPDRANYEIWFIDYLDGNLDDSRIDQLFSFLAANPDLLEEFNELSVYSLKPGEGTFRNKNLLKKTPDDLSDSQFDYLSVAAAEGDLTVDQAKELDGLLEKYPGKRRAFEIIGKLKLTAPAIKFRHKSKLKKLTLPGKIIRMSAIGVGAAASILLMISILRQPPVTTTVTTAEFLRTDSTESQPAVAAIGRNADESPVNTPAKTLAPLSDNLTAGLPEEIPAGVKTDKSEYIFGDSTAGNVQPAKIEISSIRYRPDVKLYNDNAGASLVALNNTASYSDITDEAPGINDFIARLFREKILKSDNPRKGELRAYEIADAGINGLNKLFGLNMSLEENVDDKGEVTSVYFNSRLIKFNAPVKKDASAE